MPLFREKRLQLKRNMLFSDSNKSKGLQNDHVYCCYRQSNDSRRGCRVYSPLQPLLGLTFVFDVYLSRNVFQ